MEDFKLMPILLGALAIVLAYVVIKQIERVQTGQGLGFSFNEKASGGVSLVPPAKVGAGEDVVLPPATISRQIII